MDSSKEEKINQAVKILELVWRKRKKTREQRLREITSDDIEALKGYTSKKVFEKGQSGKGKTKKRRKKTRKKTRKKKRKKRKKTRKKKRKKTRKKRRKRRKKTRKRK